MYILQQHTDPKAAKKARLRSYELQPVMPKSERESLLLTLSWQVVPAVGSKQHSIAGSLNGSKRVPRKFLPRATTAFEDAECFPLPAFTLSMWGISVPDAIQPEGCPLTLEHRPEPLPDRPQSNSSKPSVSAIKEAESFFADSYRPLLSKSAPSPAISGSPGDELPLSAGSKRPSALSDATPQAKDRQIDSALQVPLALVQSKPPTTPPQSQQQQHQQQQQQHYHQKQPERRQCRWAKQYDANYLQSLRDMQGAGGGSPRILAFKASLEYALATSTSSVYTATLSTAALPIRSPALVYQSAALRLQSSTLGTRSPASVSSSATSSWWGITVASSDDRIAQQLLQRAMLNSQGSLRGKSIQEWWAWWYSVNARTKGLASAAAAPRTLHVGWGVSPDVAQDIIRRRLEIIQPSMSLSFAADATISMPPPTSASFEKTEANHALPSFEDDNQSRNESESSSDSGSESNRVSSTSSNDDDSDNELIVPAPSKNAQDSSHAASQPTRRRAGACFKIALCFSSLIKDSSFFEDPFSEVIACPTSDFFAEERSGAEYEFWSSHWQLPQASHGAIVFEAKARNDVYVVLSRNMHSPAQRLGPCSSAYEICIGGWNNTKSLIRRGAQGSTMIDSNCTLPSRNFTKWWISVNRKTCRIAVGLGSVPGVNVQFWAWDDKYITDLNFFSFSCWDACVEFRAIGTCAAVPCLSSPAADRQKIVMHERFDKHFASSLLCGEVRGQLRAAAVGPGVHVASEVALIGKSGGFQGTVHRSRAETAMNNLSNVLSHLPKVPSGCIRCEPFKRNADGSCSGREAWKNLLTASLKEKEDDQRLGGSNLDLRRQLAATGFIMAPTAARRKRVVVQRSPIHNLGLFARERIDKGALVIEYTGELLRSKLADFRERKYLGMGLESFYLFRLDEEYVVDGTMKGSSARFINHSCNGNTVVKIIKAGGSSSGMRKCITFYSIRVIEIGEEITVDYKLKPEPEEQRIPCLCNAENCRLFLN